MPLVWQFLGLLQISVGSGGGWRRPLRCVLGAPAPFPPKRRTAWEQFAPWTRGDVLRGCQWNGPAPLSRTLIVIMLLLLVSSRSLSE